MKRILALLLALLLLSAFPSFALASDLEAGDETEANPEGTPAIEIVLSSPEPSEDPTDTPVPEETPAIEETPAPEDTPAPEPTPTVQPAETPEPEETPTQEETPEPLAIVDQLIIDDKHLYENMDLTYEQGYVPVVENGYAYLTLPLLGETYDEKVTVTLNLGSPSSSPFVFGNYSKTVTPEDGVYIFAFAVPLSGSRINGTYPVILTAKYLDSRGSQAQQDFTLYVTITDGSNPPSASTGGSGGRQTVTAPQLFIKSCQIEPGTVGGEETFTVSVEIENIGNLQARNVLLSYGSSNSEILPVETNNMINLGEINRAESKSTSFEMKTTKDVLAGNQSVFVKVDYIDIYGGSFSESRNFSIRVTQPAEAATDPILFPKQVTAGETVPVSVVAYNTGKSTLHNVTVTVNGGGMIPKSSAFFGDLPPGQTDSGTIEVYIGTLSMTGGAGDYGKTDGVCKITYTDDDGVKQSIETKFSSEILAPKEDEGESAEEKKAASQWWISALVAFAVIAITTSIIVTARFSRIMKMK